MNSVSLTDEASFMFLTTMLKQLVVTVQMDPTEFTLWMTTERKVILVSSAHVRLQRRASVKREFMRKHFFVFHANVANKVMF
jgi:hypothetical protein